MIFAFMGEKGHGKSTCAKSLVSLGYPLVNFADPLKEACKIVFDLTDEQLEDHVQKETPLPHWPFKTPRELMQLVGTDMFRAWDPQTWVQAYKRNVERKLGIARVWVAAEGRYDTPRGITTSDIRRPNEALYVRGTDFAGVPDGVVIRVFDPRKPIGVDTHIAERDHASITPDHELINDGTIADLQAKVRDIVRMYEAAR